MENGRFQLTGDYFSRIKKAPANQIDEGFSLIFILKRYLNADDHGCRRDGRHHDHHDCRRHVSVGHQP